MPQTIGQNERPNASSLPAVDVPPESNKDGCAGSSIREHSHDALRQTIPTASMTSYFEDDYYRMDKKRRGFAVIFNNEHFESEEDRRKGTEKDVAALETTLGPDYLGFDVTCHNDLADNEIRDELKKLSKADHSECDSFCVVVLTHGMRDGLIYLRRGIYLVEDLWTPFLNNKCLSLAGKPKFFFIQACRGKESHYGTQLLRLNSTTEMDSTSRENYVIPSHSDILVSYSTIPGALSPRDESKGTWFIQSLCKVLKERYKTSDLLSILTMVNREVALNYEYCRDETSYDQYCGMKVTPIFTSTLMRNVFFSPKSKRLPIEPTPTSEST